MGSNAILEALKGGRLPAKAAFLVGPNAEFVFPWWGPTAVRILPPAVIQGLKRFVIWYMRRFRVNARDDPEQMARYVRTIREADPERLKLSALAVVGYSVMPGLETISTPVAVACCSTSGWPPRRRQKPGRCSAPTASCLPSRDAGKPWGRAVTCFRSGSCYGRGDWQGHLPTGLG